MKALLPINRFKSGGGIHIKPENRGKFTEYCKSKGYGGVTNQCISEGKKSNSETIRKRARFAGAARKWRK